MKITESTENLVESTSDVSISECPDSGPTDNVRLHTPYKMRLELAAFLVYFGVNMSSVIFDNQVLYQTCTVIYGYNETICESLGTGKVKNDSEMKAIETIVQPFASKIFMTESLVQAIIPAILALFFGAWTDKFGRKPVILLTISGYLGFLSIKAVIAAISLWQDVNPWVYIAVSIPLALCGGDCDLLSAIYCYVADLTTLRERPFKMCIMAGIIALGDILGQLSSSYLYEASNACVVFALSAAVQLVAIVYVLFVIKESIRQDQLSSEPKLKGFFDRGLLKDMLYTVFKKRENFETIIIWCILIPLAVTSFDDDVRFLFIRNKFGFTIQDYATFNAIRLVIKFIGGFIGIVILQVILRVKLTMMTLIAYGSYCIRAAFYAGAEAPWYLYVAIAVSCLSGVATPMSQSMLTNTVPPSDIGKVFTLLYALQAIAPLAASPLYTMVYNSTLDTHPGAYNFISVGLFFLCFILTGFVHVIDLRHLNVNVIKTR